MNRACKALRLAESTFYRAVVMGKASRWLEQRIKALSRKYPTYGYRIVTELLRGEGWQVNRKRVQRVRRREELQAVKKVRKPRRKLGGSGERVRAQKPNQVWSHDLFMIDWRMGQG